mmetsp:Transcript_5280/g.18939  ORF Transcript_5280/g.18939 Transcript_5280/m.18939 type:complete len:596 (-) Transcript_5280:477-2264(-)
MSLPRSRRSQRLALVRRRACTRDQPRDKVLRRAVRPARGTVMLAVLTIGALVVVDVAAAPAAGHDEHDRDVTVAVATSGRADSDSFRPPRALSTIHGEQASIIGAYRPRVRALVDSLPVDSLREISKAKRHYVGERALLLDAPADRPRSSFQLSARAGVNAAVATNFCLDPESGRARLYRGSADEPAVRSTFDANLMADDSSGFPWNWEITEVGLPPPGRHEALWLEGTSALLSPAFPRHITHFSEAAMLLFHAALHPDVYPWHANPDRVVVLRVDSDDLEWSKSYLEAILSVFEPRSKAGEAVDNVGGDGIPVLYRDQLLGLLHERRSESHSLVCFERAAIGAQTYHQFGFAADPWEAELLRQASFRHFDVPKPPLLSPRHKLRTLVVDRGGDGRKRMVNADDVMAVLNATGLANFDYLDAPEGQPVVIENHPHVWTFEAQISAMRHTDVLVAVHGGVLGNVQFMEPGSVVIAIMPSNYIEYEWANLAAGVGVTMLLLPATDFERATGRCPRHFISCEKETRPFANKIERCRPMWHCETIVDVGALEVLFRQADYMVRLLPDGKRGHTKGAHGALADVGVGVNPEGVLAVPMVD